MATQVPPVQLHLAARLSKTVRLHKDASNETSPWYARWWHTCKVSQGTPKAMTLQALLWNSWRFGKELFCHSIANKAKIWKLGHPFSKLVSNRNKKASPDKNLLVFALNAFFGSENVVSKATHCSSHLVKVFVCWFPRSLSVAVSQTFSTDKLDKPTKPLAISSEESVLGSAQKGTHSEGQHPVSTVWSADDRPYWPMDHYIPLLPFQWRGSMPSATHWWGVDIRHTLREWAVCFSRCW